MFSGGALSRFTILALGIMPYISASIIMQLASHAVPHLEQLKKEGETGRRKITQYTRYGTLAAGFVSGIWYFCCAPVAARSGVHPGIDVSDDDSYNARYLEPCF